MIDAWREDLEHDGGRLIRFEVELWYRNSEEKRQQSSAIVTNLIQQLGGQVLAESLHDGIAYHGILAELPANTMECTIYVYRITDDFKCELIKKEKIFAGNKDSSYSSATVAFIPKLSRTVQKSPSKGSSGAA